MHQPLAPRLSSPASLSSVDGGSSVESGLSSFHSPPPTGDLMGLFACLLIESFKFIFEILGFIFLCQVWRSKIHLYLFFSLLFLVRERQRQKGEEEDESQAVSVLGMEPDMALISRACDHDLNSEQELEAQLTEPCKCP